MLQKMFLVSFGAKNEVSVQSSARLHELERHASKEGTKFSKCHCWFQYGKLVWQENLVGIRHNYMAHSSKIRHVNSWQFRKIFGGLREEDVVILSFSILHFIFFISVSFGGSKASHLGGVIRNSNLSLGKSSNFKIIKID